LEPTNITNPSKKNKAEKEMICKTCYQKEKRRIIAAEQGRTCTSCKAFLAGKKQVSRLRNIQAFLMTSLIRRLLKGFARLVCQSLCCFSAEIRLLRCRKRNY
jgi:uncharacterized paraquat-inducible protein A